MQTSAIEIEKKYESGYFDFYYNIWRLIDKITKQWETKTRQEKVQSPWYLRKSCCIFWRRKKHIQWTHIEIWPKKKERKKTNVLPINGTHSCYIYCGRLYFLSLTPLKHQQHFYNINKKIWKKVFIKVEVHRSWLAIQKSI